MRSNPRHGTAACILAAAVTTLGPLTAHTSVTPGTVMPAAASHPAITSGQERPGLPAQQGTPQRGGNQCYNAHRCYPPSTFNPCPYYTYPYYQYCRGYHGPRNNGRNYQYSYYGGSGIGGNGYNGHRHYGHNDEDGNLGRGGHGCVGEFRYPYGCSHGETRY